MHPVLFHAGAILIPAYGAVAALGVLLALLLGQWLARPAGIDGNRLWNLNVIGLFAAIIGSRLLLVAVNWGALRLHPQWLLGLAMIHHPLVSAIGLTTGLGAAAGAYGRWQKMPWRATADALAAPVLLGMAFEQMGALLAGSGYGTETAVAWAVTYSDPLAARWSGTPLGVPLHPVQAYAAAAYLALAAAISSMVWVRKRPGDVAGVALMGAGVALYVTEFWRDVDGRGRLLAGAMDGPQVVAVVLVLLGALLLRERERAYE